MSRPVTLGLFLLVSACAAETGDMDSEPDVPRGMRAFRFPLVEPERFTERVGVDHDPVEQGDGVGGAICTDYLGRGFPNCYDQHDGSDFILQGGFDAMDAGSSPIVAAAPGVVIETEDGNYDRCHADLETMENDCDGHPMSGNHVILDHGDGVHTLYWHMMEGSVAVEVGDTLQCGDLLGLVGSSGNSAMPHLHFELEVDEAIVDPYAGPYSQEETWWSDQGYPEQPPGLQCLDLTD